MNAEGRANPEGTIRGRDLALDFTQLVGRAFALAVALGLLLTGATVVLPAPADPGSTEASLRPEEATSGCLLIRRRVFERLGTAKPFDRIGDISEDLSFFYRTREVGVQVWCHPGVMCGHITRDIVTARHFSRYADRIPGREIELDARPLVPVGEEIEE